MNQDERGLTNGVTMLDERSVDVCGVCVWFVGLAGELRKKARSRSTQHGLAAELLQFQKLSQLQLFPPLPIWTFSDPRTPAENIDELQKEFLQRMVGCIEESEDGAN